MSAAKLYIACVRDTGVTTVTTSYVEFVVLYIYQWLIQKNLGLPSVKWSRVTLTLQSLWNVLDLIMTRWSLITVACRNGRNARYQSSLVYLLSGSCSRFVVSTFKLKIAIAD